MIPPAEPGGPPGLDIQGHRGARGLLPENSLPGFLRALELGVTTLEMDCVVSRDRHVVVSHDPVFSSVICRQPSGAPIAPGDEQGHRIFEMDYAEVARYDCGSLPNPRFPRQALQAVAKPLLSDVFRMAEDYVSETGRPAVRYNIETKSTPDGDGILHPEPDEFTDLLLDQVVRNGLAHRVIVQSFDPRTLRVARDRDVGVRLSLLIALDHDRGVSANLNVLGFRPHVYSPDHRLVDARLMEAARAMGMAVIPWTVNEADDMRRLIALGVDGLISDYPDVALQVAAEAE